MEAHNKRNSFCEIKSNKNVLVTFDDSETTWNKIFSQNPKVKLFHITLNLKT